MTAVRTEPATGHASPQAPAAPAHRSPLLAVLGRLSAGRAELGLAVVGALLEHCGAILAFGATGWAVGAAASGWPPERLTAAAVLALAAVCASAVGNWVLGQFGHAFAFKSQTDLRLQLFDALERSAPRVVQGRRTGDLASVVMGDVEALERFFAHLWIGAVVAVATGAASVVVLGLVHPALALTALAGMALAAGLAVLLSRREQARAAALRSELGAVNADVVDAVQGLRELLVFGRVESWYGRIARRTAGLRGRRVDHARVTGLQAAVTDGLVSATTIAVVVAVIGLVSSGALAMTWAAAAIMVTVAAFGPIAAVIGMMGPLAPLRASARRVLAVLDEPAHVEDAAVAAPDLADTAVRFEGVRFGYPGSGREALRGLDLDLPPRSMTALVGPSGSGKSTSVNLLLRFWDADAGRITIGGRDLREFPLDDLRRLVTVVPQDVYLFTGTIADNLRLGAPDAAQADLERAARAANAHGFITGFPDGYGSQVGERGAMLSGGQRQRLAVARALLTDAPVLVLDEATSNLDAHSERLLQESLEAIRSERTVLVIAHRLSTVRNADQVVVLDEGRAVESGTHSELLARNGRYAALMSAQSGRAAAL